MLCKWIAEQELGLDIENTKQDKPRTFRKICKAMKVHVLKGHGTEEEMLIFLGNDKFIHFGIIRYCSGNLHLCKHCTFPKGVDFRHFQALKGKSYLWK